MLNHVAFGKKNCFLNSELFFQRKDCCKETFIFSKTEDALNNSIVPDLMC